MRKKLAILILSFFMAACMSGQKQEPTASPVASKNESAQEKKENESSYAGFLASIVKIETFDNGRVLESGQGFFVAEDIVVTRLSLMGDATEAKCTTLNDSEKFNIAGYLAIDRINDLVLLKTEGIKRPAIPLYSGVVPNGAKTIYLTNASGSTVPLHRGKILSYTKVNGNYRYTLNNQFRSSSYGTPVFVSNQQAIGLAFSETVDYEVRYYAIPSGYITELLKTKSERVSPLKQISLTDPALSEANSRIKGLRIETDYGNILIRLHNQTPAYRDNFIKLVREHYFDSLLIHRVIKGFCIQSGAADTRYASSDDVVGWKGPGYTLPAHIVPGLFHRRGVIGSPRKPDTKNSKRRSDGSQFYIVTGRVYNDAELNDIEKENGIKFTVDQRRVYKTEGGAPHIDGTYTIFGEVTQGMEIADQIVKKEVGSEFRPKEDIRVKRIVIIE